MHVHMMSMSSVEWTDLDFKISVALTGMLCSVVMFDVAKRVISIEAYPTKSIILNDHLFQQKHTFKMYVGIQSELDNI